MEQNKKRNRTMTVGLIVLVLAIVTSCLAGFTYAKYTSNKNLPGDTGTVAAWKWDVTEGTTATAATEFKLFNTIAETDGSVDDDVHQTSSKNDRLAPGTKGTFTITVKNSSEVNGKVSIKLTETITNKPAEAAEASPIVYTYSYSVDGATAVTGTITSGTAIEIENVPMGKSVVFTTSWTWAFGTDTTNDANDTLYGTATTAPTFTVAADLTFTQKD